MELQSAALSEPMLSPAECLEQLAAARRTPEAVLRASVHHFAEVAPALLALLERAAAGGAMSHEDDNLLFYGLHVLGAGRERRAFQPLVRFLRRDPSAVEAVLGDAETESIPRIIASVFDGDADALFALIVDRTVDEFMRYGLMLATAFLAWDGRIERARMIGFLERFDDERLTADYDATWDAFQYAIALLGLRELAPRVERAWREDRISEVLTDRSDFADDLARAEAAPADRERFTEAHQGYVEDVVAALAWMGNSDEEEDESLDDDGALAALADEEDAEDDEDLWRLNPQLPVTNPMRHVGRNDPCPCGSGKKAKRCCLAR